MLKIPSFFSVTGLVIQNKKQGHKRLSERNKNLTTSISLLTEKDQPSKLERKEKKKLFSFLQIKNCSFLKTKEGIQKKEHSSFFDKEKGKSLLSLKSFFQNSSPEGGRGNNLQPTGSNQISLISPNLPHVREGGAIKASKAVSLVIDAVFMPVNKVNYIIEINEQSVMSKNISNTNSLSFTHFGSSGTGRIKGKTLPIFDRGLGFLPVAKQSLLTSLGLLRRTPESKGSSKDSKKELVVLPKKTDILQVPAKKERKKSFFKSVAAQKIIGNQLNVSINPSFLDFSAPEDYKENDLQRKEGKKMRLSDKQIKTPLKNNIILEIWTNGSIHPRQALYEACKNLLSLFSKLEKATPLAFEKF